MTRKEEWGEKKKNEGKKVIVDNAASGFFFSSRRMKRDLERRKAIGEIAKEIRRGRFLSPSPRNQLHSLKV
jgi:hypothetical protein